MARQKGDPMKPIYDHYLKGVTDDQRSIEKYQEEVNRYIKDVDEYCESLYAEINKRDKRIDSLKDKINDLRFENLKLEVKLEICYKKIMEDHCNEINKSLEVIKRDIIK